MSGQMTARTIGTCSVLTALAATLAAQTPAPSPSPSPSPVAPAAETRLQVYGFLRTDAIYDDSRPDAAQTPLFIQSEREGAEDQANFTLHPRLSRLGVNFAGPSVERLGGAALGGRVEFDWQNGGRESRATPRFRHVFATLTWAGATLLLGSTSDVISPLVPAVNGDTVMWNAGNIGDRRPQVRLTVQPKAEKLQWSLSGALGLTGAVDQQDLDNDTVRDGEAAALPNIQGRFGLSHPLGKRRLAVGVWGHFARMKVASAVAGRTRWDGSGFGVDVELPLASRFTIRGEAWTGSTLSDFRGGIGQAVNRATGEEIGSRGGWVELGVDLTGAYTVWLGYAVDAPEEDDLFAGARSRNGAWSIVNRVALRPLVLGVDYLRWTTEYVGAPHGTDNRVNAYLIYSF
jgi:hypothetical protein